jgi:hypothetical protein
MLLLLLLLLVLPLLLLLLLLLLMMLVCCFCCCRFITLMITGATGDRLKEGSAINQSLSTLGLCVYVCSNVCVMWRCVHDRLFVCRVECSPPRVTMRVLCCMCVLVCLCACVSVCLCVVMGVFLYAMCVLRHPHSE